MAGVQTAPTLGTKECEMSESPDQYGILVAVDGSPESDAAVRWAAREAALQHTRLTLLHVVAPVIVSWPVATLESGFYQWQQDNAKDVIDQAQKTVQSVLSSAEQPPIHVEIQDSAVVPALVDASGKARMVVVGSRGLGAVGRAVLGSVSSALVRHAHCPTVVIRAGVGDEDTARPVLLGVDGSPASEAATALAFDEASRRGVGLVALHAWSDFGAVPTAGMDWRQFEEDGNEILAERLAGWQEKYPDVTVERRIVYNRPVHWLIEASENAQLVVVGSHGRGGFTGMLLGSVSAGVVHQAKAPVVVVRSR